MFYLQTDDRDDYFETLGKKPKRKYKSISLFYDGKEILNEVPYFKVREYCAKNYLKKGDKGKKIWRKKLEANGYTVVSNYL